MWLQVRLLCSGSGIFQFFFSSFSVTVKLRIPWFSRILTVWTPEEMYPLWLSSFLQSLQSMYTHKIFPSFQEAYKLQHKIFQNKWLFSSLYNFFFYYYYSLVKINASIFFYQRHWVETCLFSEWLLFTTWGQTCPLLKCHFKMAIAF